MTTDNPFITETVESEPNLEHLDEFLTEQSEIMDYCRAILAKGVKPSEAVDLLWIMSECSQAKADATGALDAFDGFMGCKDPDMPF